ncbi:MAG: hypothetical protein ABJN36_02185 [Cyclobacteriaceae bacterium]
MKEKFLSQNIIDQLVDFQELKAKKSRMFQIGFQNHLSTASISTCHSKWSLTQQCAFYKVFARRKSDEVLDPA